MAKGLSGVNTQSGFERELARLGIKPQSAAEYRRRSMLATPQVQKVGLAMPEDFGKSKYDDTITDVSQLYNLDENRYEQQSTAAALGNAFVKMLGTAGTTLASTIGGPIVGTATAINEGRWSGLWDNEFTQALSDIDNELEENFKIYQSERQKEADWFSVDNLTSASFWGDDVIKNAGFMLGAAAAGSGFTGSLGLASRAFGLAQKASKATNVTTAILGSVFSAAGEGAIEAKQTAQELVELNTKRLKDAIDKEYKEAIDEYNANKGTLTPYPDGNGAYDKAYVEFKKKEADLRRKLELGKKQIAEDARSAGNWTMALNIPILTTRNFITLGKGLSKSFNNAANVARNTERATAGKFINDVDNIGKKANEILRNIASNPAEVTKNAINYTTKDFIAARRAYSMAKPIITEGSEEMNQAWASSLAGYFKAYREDPNDYWRAKENPGSEQKLLGFMEAASKGFGDSWGDWNTWEEGFVGGLMGATGIPMPTKLMKQDKSKSKYNPARYFSWEGGSFQNLSDFNRELNESTRGAEILNRKVNDPKFWNRMRNAVAHFYSQASMGEAAENGDIKSYKDDEEKQFVQDLEAFVRAGKVDDFREIIKQVTQDLSDEDVINLINRNAIKVSAEENAANQREVIQNKIDNLNEKLSAAKNLRTRRSIENRINKLTRDLNNVVGVEHTISQYTDANGNLIKSIKEIKEDLSENGKKLLDRTDSYIQSLDFVNNISNGKLTEDQSGNLAYLHYMSKSQRNRSNKLLEKLTKNNFIPREFEIKSNESIENLNNTIGKLYGVEFYKDSNNNTKVRINDNYKSDKSKDFLSNYIFGRGQEASIGAMTTILENLNGLNSDQLDDAITSLTDGIKLRQDSFEFESTLRDYLKNPSKVDEAKEKAESERNKEIRDATIDNKSVPELVKDIEEGKIDTDNPFDFDRDEFESLKRDKSKEEDSEESSRKKKLKDAQDIVDTKELVKSEASNLEAPIRDDVFTLLENSSNLSSSKEELLDLDTEAFNNPDALSLREEEQAVLNDMVNKGVTPEELEAAAQEMKQIRLDKAKGELQNIIRKIKRDANDLNSIPSSEDNKSAESTQSTKSKDPTDSVDSVNNTVGTSKANKTEGNSTKGDNEEDNKTKSNHERNDDETGVTTPNTTDPNNVETESNTGNINTRGYWKLNTTEYPIHKTQGNEPYYKSVKDPKRRALYKAIFEFLKNNNTFERVKSGEVKKGQKVRFAFSKTLQDTINKEVGEDIPVLLIVDENGNILGDLANPKDSGIFNNFPGLRDFYNRATKSYNESNKEDELYIIPNYESTIAHMLIGRPLYSNSRQSLNKLSNGRRFNLGIVLSSTNMGMSPGRKRSQGPSNMERDAMMPIHYRVGQPFLMIETSDPRRKYYPVPITMPTFGSATRESSLHKLIAEHIAKLQDIYDNNSLDRINSWKDTLYDLLAVADIYVGVEETRHITKDSDTITKKFTLKIKRAKTDTAWTTVYAGNEVNPNTILTNLENLNIPFQISKKYINGTYNGRFYNELIGELAFTNIEEGALHTVNDFFTINPIINGKEHQAERPKDVERESDGAIKKANKNAKINDFKNFVGNVIIPTQENVDKTRTDSEYYYIKEDDGKYHKYERLHKILPNNFKGTSRYDDRTLKADTDIYNIVVQFFDPLFDISNIRKPENLSQAAFDSLINYLKEFDKYLRNNDLSVYANDLVLYHKYPDGRRVADKLDILLVDSKGNYQMLNIKTSRFSFYRQEFNEKDSLQEMSTKDFHTLQLSSCKKLFKDQFDKNVQKLYLMPFVLAFDNGGNGDNVAMLVHEKSIKLTPVNVDNYFKSSSNTSNEIGLKKEDKSKPTVTRDEAISKLISTGEFDNPIRKALLEKLSDDTIVALSEKKKVILKRGLKEIDALIKPSMSNEEIEKTVKENIGITLNRDVEKENTSSDLQRELSIINKILPRLSDEERVIISKSILRTPSGKAWGQFKNGIITIYTNAAKGTIYHEAFHYVFNTVMSNDEIEKAFESAKDKYGNLSNVALEEKMAEEFRNYMQNEETFTGKLKNLWVKIKNMLDKLRGNEHYLDNLYYQISKGKFSNKISDSETVRDNGITTSSISQYHRDKLSYGNLSSEDKNYVKEIGISLEEYSNMTQEQKEVLFKCKY